MASTIEGLQSRVDADLGWRKKEISALRTSAIRASQAIDLYCRAGIVLVCAHFEGFLRATLQRYIDFVFAQKVPIRKLTPPFVSIAFFADVKNAADAEFPGSERHHIKVAKRILEGIDQPCSNPKWKIDLGGNPSSTVVSQLVASCGLNRQLGLSDAEWAATKVLIDEQILRVRHKIAHGEGFRVERDEFLEQSKRVMRLFDVVAELVIGAAAAAAYLSNDELA